MPCVRLHCPSQECVEGLAGAPGDLDSERPAQDGSANGIHNVRLTNRQHEISIDHEA